MYFDYLDSLGPEIEIRFTDAPGIEEGRRRSSSAASWQGQ